jgi:hypothetical protein
MDPQTAFDAAITRLSHTARSKRNVSRTAREHGIGRMALTRRLQGHHQIGYQPANQALNKTQEEELVKWVLQYSDRGFPVGPSDIGAKASHLRQQLHPGAEPFDRTWPSRFQARNKDEISSRITSSRDIARTTSVTQRSIHDFFQKVGPSLKSALSWLLTSRCLVPHG